MDVVSTTPASACIGLMSILWISINQGISHCAYPSTCHRKQFDFFDHYMDIRNSPRLLRHGSEHPPSPTRDRLRKCPACRHGIGGSGHPGDGCLPSNRGRARRPGRRPCRRPHGGRRAAAFRGPVHRGALRAVRLSYASGRLRAGRDAVGHARAHRHRKRYRGARDIRLRRCGAGPAPGIAGRGQRRHGRGPDAPFAALAGNPPAAQGASAP